MRRVTAIPAVKKPSSKLSLEVSLYVEELESEHFGLEGHRMRVVQAGCKRLIDHSVGLQSLICDCPDRTLEDLPFVHHKGQG
jgi:hypothetical protein